MRSLDFTIGFSSTSRPASLKYPRSIAAMSGTCPNHVVDAAWSSLIGDCARVGTVSTMMANARTITHATRLIGCASPTSLVVDRRRQPHGLGRAPAVEKRGIDVIHLDPERLARRQRIAAVRPPAGDRQVATGAIGNRAEQIDHGEELDEVAFSRRARLGEIDLTLRVEARDLEDVQHVVHVELGEVVWRDRARQIVMAG